MAADSVCGHFQIPRPKCIGMEFVTIKGSHSGFYRTINKNIAHKYGLLQQQTFRIPTTKRPSIPTEWTNIKNNNIEEEKMKNNNGSIAEEPEVVSEPLPDYEVDEIKEKESVAINISERKDTISVPIELTPSIPPLGGEEEMALLKLEGAQNNIIKE